MRACATYVLHTSIKVASTCSEQRYVREESKLLSLDESIKVAVLYPPPISASNTACMTSAQAETQT